MSGSVTTPDLPALHATHAGIWLAGPDGVREASRGEAIGRAAETPIVRPAFEAGDALLFDELLLHSTAADPSMTATRYAIESWFFGGSAFPGEYAPLALG